MPGRRRFRRARASALAAAAVVVGLALVTHPVPGQEREAPTVREDQAVAEQRLVRLTQFFDVPVHAVNGTA